MSSNLPKDTLDIVNRLIYLSKRIKDKCEILSKSSEEEATLGKLLKLCVIIRKNCAVFEQILRREKDSCTDSSNVIGDPIIIMNLLEIIGEENCKSLKNDVLNKFKVDLTEFAKNYFNDLRDPVFVNLYQLHYGDSRNENIEHSENQAKMRSSSVAVEEIFGSDSDTRIGQKDSSKETTSPQPSTSSFDGISRNGQISSKNVQNELPTETEKAKNDDKIAECIDVNAKKAEEEGEGESTTIDLPKETTMLNNFSETTEIDSLSNNQNNLDDQMKTADLEKTETHNLSAEPKNLERTTEECAAVNVHSSEPVKQSTIEKEVISVSLKENVENSELEGVSSSTNSSEFAKESTDKMDIVNSSMEPQDIQELQNKRHSVPLDPSKTVHKSVEIDADNSQVSAEKDLSTTSDNKSVAIYVDRSVEKALPTTSDNESVQIDVDRSVDKALPITAGSSAENKTLGLSKTVNKSVEIGAENSQVSVEKGLSTTSDNKSVAIDVDRSVEKALLTTSDNKSAQIDVDRPVEKALPITAGSSAENICLEPVVENIKLSHSNSEEVSSPKDVNSSESNLDLEKNKGANAPQSQESSSELQSAAVSAVETSKDISECGNNEGHTTNVEIEPSSQSTIVDMTLRDYDDLDVNSSESNLDLEKNKVANASQSQESSSELQSPAVSAVETCKDISESGNNEGHTTNVEVEPSSQSTIVDMTSRDYYDLDVNSSESNLDLEKNKVANAAQSQESSSELQSAAVSAVGTSKDISECGNNEGHATNVEVEPSSQSTIVDMTSRDYEGLDNGSTKDSGEKVQDTFKQQDFLNELGLSSKSTNYEEARMLRDELMEIFAEENCQEDENGVMREVRDDVDDDDVDDDDVFSYDGDNYSESKAEAALKELEEESLSDLGMLSNSELELSSIDGDSLLCVSSVSEEDDEDIQEENSVDNFVQKRCSVILERTDLKKMQQTLRSSQEPLALIEETTNEEKKQSDIMFCSERLETSEDDSSSKRKSDNEDTVINRLCQLSTLNRKRRRSNEKIPKRKIKRKRCSISLSVSGTDTSDLTGYSSVSETEIKKERILEEDKEEFDNIPLDPNTLLAEIVCHTIHDSDSDSSGDISNEEEGKKRKKKQADKAKTDCEDTKIAKEKEESWKDDPLLRGNLNVPSENERKKEGISKKRRRKSSDSDAEPNVRKRLRMKDKVKYLFPDDSESSTADSSDDFEDDCKEQKEKKIKTNEDSDIEFVNFSTNSIINLDSEEETDNKIQTRRHIKAVLSMKKLTESTQRAAEEEEARIRELEKQKQMKCSQASQESTSAEDDDELVLGVSSDGYKVVIDSNLGKKLFPHQLDGIKFMWESCYLSVDSLRTFDGTGCILAHNMGLGKTFQVVTLVHALFSHSITNTKHVLIVCPLSTVSGWKKEFQNALKMAEKTKDIKITTLECSNRSARCKLISRWRRAAGVLIVGYDAFSRLTKNDNSHQAREIREALVNPGPDLVVCDEGHLLKNGKSMRTKALMEIKTKRRIALTGTPLQNNLQEYYFMVQFVKPNLLGNKSEFNRQFVNPIMNGQYEDSLEHDITLMKKRTHVLHRLLKNTVQRYEATELKKYLQNMKDYAIFIQLHPLQEKLYKTYLEAVQEREQNMKSFFVDYQILKYICSHPQLFYTMETQNAQRNKNAIKEKEIISEEPEVLEFEGLPQDWWKIHCSDDIKTSIDFGTKLQVMMEIIEEAEKIGEKVLIFTSSLIELSSVEYFLKLKGTSKCSSWRSKRDYFRMDGTVPPSVRTEMCEMFNDEKNETLRVFLMSHKVGGLGLNLTAANRVILLGANFNPSLDSQSIYRAYRFGQTKVVYIYRLLSMGTMEEKIYHRCVTKLAIASRVVDKHQITRHYKNLDLEDLYKTEMDLSLQRPTPAKPDDDILSAILLKFECVYKFHHHQKLLENRPDEDLNEEDQMKAWEEFKDMLGKGKNAIQNHATTSKVPELVQKQWSQLHPFVSAIPLVPSLRGSYGPQLPNSFSSGYFNNPAVHGTSSTIETVIQNICDSIRQLKNGTVMQPEAVSKISGAGRTALPAATAQSIENLNKASTVKSHKTLNKKSTQIGPNPLLLAKLQHRKENLGNNLTTTPWRTSSSDDFQRPSGSNANTGKKKTPSNVQAPMTTTESDIVLIDISEEQPPTIQEQLDELRKRNLTITATSRSKKKENPTIIDIT